MSTSRVAAQPLALKDRIAALQQRSVSPPAPSAQGSPSKLSVNNGQLPRGGLRDKIAKFEERGGTPVPRGSFGLGAPPPDDGKTKKRGELYGNRISGLRPHLLSPQTTGVSQRSFASPSFDSVSTLADVPDFPPLSRDNTGGSFAPPEDYQPFVPPTDPDNADAETGDKLGELAGAQPDEPSEPVTVSQEVSSGSTTQPVAEASPSIGSAPQPAEETSPPIVAAPQPSKPLTSAAVEKLQNDKLSSSSSDEPSQVFPPSQESAPSDPACTSESSPSPSVRPLSTGSEATITAASPPMSPSSPDLDLRPPSLIATDVRIVTAQPRTVSPARSRAVLVPAPSRSPTPERMVSHPNEEKPGAPAPVKIQPAPTGFKAVVHRKVVEDRRPLPSSSSSDPEAEIKSPTKYAPQFARVKATTVKMEPSSPSASELADLMANAAFLEQQLSGGIWLSSPGPDVLITPDISSTPEENEAGGVQTPLADSHDVSELPYVDNNQPMGSPDTIEFPKRKAPDASSPLNLSDIPSTPQEIPPTPPPKSPESFSGPGYFSRSLRSLRSVHSVRHSLSISADSEQSSDDSMPVATPPSPTFESASLRPIRDDESVTLSVRERRKSTTWRAVQRAGSTVSRNFADKLWARGRAKSNVSAQSHEADDGASTQSRFSQSTSTYPHENLSPSQTPPPPVPPLPNGTGASGDERPISWVSNSSLCTSSSQKFDLDAFPAVPQDVPPPAYTYLNGDVAHQIDPMHTTLHGHDEFDQSYREVDLNRAATLPSRPSRESTRSSSQLSHSPSTHTRASIIRRKHY